MRLSVVPPNESKIDFYIIYWAIFWIFKFKKNKRRKRERETKGYIFLFLLMKVIDWSSKNNKGERLFDKIMINLDFKEKRRNYQFKKYLERRTRRREQQLQHISLPFNFYKHYQKLAIFLYPTLMNTFEETNHKAN